MYIFYLNDQEKRDQIGRQRDFCAACKAEKSTSKSVTECEISTSDKERTVEINMKHFPSKSFS